jgi:hypothetical protein
MIFGGNTLLPFHRLMNAMKPKSIWRSGARTQQ